MFLFHVFLIFDSPLSVFGLDVCVHSNSYIIKVKGSPRVFIK